MKVGDKVTLKNYDAADALRPGAIHGRAFFVGLEGEIVGIDGERASVRVPMRSVMKLDRADEEPTRGRNAVLHWPVKAMKGVS